MTRKRAYEATYTPSGKRLRAAVDTETATPSPDGAMESVSIERTDTDSDDAATDILEPDLCQLNEALGLLAQHLEFINPERITNRRVRAGLEKMAQLINQMGQAEDRPGNLGTGPVATTTASSFSGGVTPEFARTLAFKQCVGRILRREVFEVDLLDRAPQSKALRRLNTILWQSVPSVCEAVQLNYLQYCRQETEVCIQHHCEKQIWRSVGGDLYDVAAESLLRQMIKEALLLRLYLAKPQSDVRLLFPDDATVVLPGIQRNDKVIVTPYTIVLPAKRSESTLTTKAREMPGSRS